MVKQPWLPQRPLVGDLARWRFIPKFRVFDHDLALASASLGSTKKSRELDVDANCHVSAQHGALCKPCIVVRYQTKVSLLLDDI